MVCQPQTQTPIVDSYCAVYHRVIRAEAEGAALAHVPLRVRQRVAANETFYRCRCEGWQNQMCENERRAQ